MAVLKLTLGQVNILDWLIIELRKTTAPGSVYASQTFAPPHPTSRNITFNNVDTAEYDVYFRESPDGIAIGSILATYNVNIKEAVQVFERRFYTVDGPNSWDPPSGQNKLIDPYLDGKIIGGVFQEGFRYLVDPTDKDGNPIANKEYDRATGGEIDLLNGLQFSSPGQIWTIDIINLQEVPQVNMASGGWGSVVDIAVDTVISSTHYNKRLRCESSNARLVITMPLLATVPEGTAFLFMCNGGNQFQNKIIRSGSDLFRIHEFTPNELTFMIGESMVMEKRTISGISYWEIYNQSPTMIQVLERLDAQWKDHPNCKPADGALYDGDDWPRPWFWINNHLPNTHYIVDAAVTGGSYVHPIGKEGLYVIHPSLKKFRVPNTQGWSKRNLASFTAYNADATRKMRAAVNAYDYPGGTQDDMLLDHFHTDLEADTAQHSGASSALSGIFGWLVNITFGGHGFARGGKTGSVGNGLNGAQQIVKNWGCVDLIRF
jgi:hypothetical protein